ncbi:hypothetical protein CLOP_g9408 [Closterium sp. NIES-67]|nr:hypothetical protein CLOP_g9408 [Closterium sp. NIES-67]
MGPKLLFVSLVVLLLSGNALAGKKVSTTSANVVPTNSEVQALKQKSQALQQQATQRTAERIGAELAAGDAKTASDDAAAALAAANKEVTNAQTAKNVANTNAVNAGKNLAKAEPAYKTATAAVDTKAKARDTAQAKYDAEVKKAVGLTGSAKTKQDTVVKTNKASLDKAVADYNKAVAAAVAPTNAYTPLKKAKDDADAVLKTKSDDLEAAQGKQVEVSLKKMDADKALDDANKKVTAAKKAETDAYTWAAQANDAYTSAYKQYTTAQSASGSTTTTSSSTTSSTTSSTILWNDNKYPGVGATTCTPPLDIPCTDNCTDNSGLQGRYVIPNGGRCATGTTPRCYGNAVLRRQCCAACTNSTSCSFWQHYIPSSLSCSNCGICYLYKPSDAQPTCETKTVTTTLNGTRTYVNASTLGRPCPYTHHDPHFRGAHGTRFEFNGAPEKTYCLLTDSSLHVNMKMRGYYDTRTIGASLLRNGLAVRTWIRELGFVWSADGVEHSFRLAARNGKSDKRDNGFLSLVEFDGRVLPSLEPGESYNLDGGLAFVFKGYEQEGGGFFDVDSYSLRIGDKLAMDIKLRPAHPLLQTPDDAQVHLNVNFKHVSRSSSVHGIMGQTYREGRTERAIDYAMLSRLLRTPFSADGDNGKGFLDGKAADYETSGVLSTDCGFSAFSKAM